MEFEGKLKTLIEEVSTSNEISIADIPSIDLYMDQITTFFDERLDHLKRNEKEPILTKTMINNYTKGKILMPPSKKKYSKKHMILLLLIYHLKQILSINDVQALLNPIVMELSAEESTINIEDFYTSFLKVKENELDVFQGEMEERLSFVKSLEIEGESKAIQELLLTVLMLIHHSSVQKRLAEKLIDQFFNVEKKKK